MLVGNAIHGTASGAAKSRALQFIQWLATESDAVDAMLRSRDVLLTVQVRTGEGDQGTVVEWEPPNTAITVTINYRANPQLALEGDLLHELILHAEPATRKHISAVSTGRVPGHAATDDAIEAEETVEHTDPAGWYRAAELALKRNDNNALLEQLIADAAGHSTAAANAVLTRLVAAGKISSDYAEELKDGLINV
jgi:hypothetical protein